jgi:hypothetical protein
MIAREESLKGGDRRLRRDPLRLCRQREIFLVLSEGQIFNFKNADF